MSSGRTIWRLVKVIGLALLVVFLGIALISYLRLRHRPAHYRPPDAVSAEQRQADYRAFEEVVRRAEASYDVDGTFAAVATTDQLNAAIAALEADGTLRRRFNLPADLTNLQVHVETDRLTVLGLMPSPAGSVVLSVDAHVIAGPRLKVDRVRAGAIALDNERTRRLVERLEALSLVFDVDRTQKVRVTGLALADGLVSVTAVREPP